jgi:hypothetical protein
LGRNRDRDGTPRGRGPSELIGPINNDKKACKMGEEGRGGVRCEVWSGVWWSSQGRPFSLVRGAGGIMHSARSLFEFGLEFTSITVVLALYVRGGTASRI